MPEDTLREDWRIDIRGARKQFGENILFYGLDLVISPGNVTRFDGPNGSGKTQLLYVLCGLAEMDGGRITLKIDDRTKLLRSARDRSSVFRFVPAHPSEVCGLTIVDFVYAATHALRPFSLGSRVRAASTFFEGIREQLEYATGRRLENDEPVSRLSIGQQKRLMLSAALHAQDAPRVLAVDEPLAGVDPGGVERMLELLRGALAAGYALLVAEHREEIEALTFDHVVPMPYGVSMATGDPARHQQDSQESASPQSDLCVVFQHTHAGYPEWELDGGDLEIQTAGVALLHGENGAGKTGFLKGILGMEPAKMSGKVNFGDQDFTSLADAQSRGEVRYMSQDRANFPDLMAGDAFAAAAGNAARNDPVLRKMVEKVGRRKRVMYLSSGNRAVLSLVQTISSRPKLALLDEPFANVDPGNKVHLLETISYARSRFGTAFLIVEHGDIAIPGAHRYTVRREGTRGYIRSEATEFR
jgi:ABC-type multidrug transport system ATPase subunit